jgi:hypothetical protein
MAIFSSVVCLFAGNVAGMESPFDTSCQGQWQFPKAKVERLPVADVTSLTELLGAGRRLDQ